MEIAEYLLYFIAGILLNMSLFHLENFAETRRHPTIAWSQYPKLVSTIWGLVQLFFAILILLLLHYKFELRPSTGFIFLGFSVWAVFLGITSERADRKAKV